MSSSMSETNTLYEACSTFDHTFYRVHENIAKTNDLRRLLHALDIKSKDQVQLEETTNIINKKLSTIVSQKILYTHYTFYNTDKLLCCLFCPTPSFQPL